MTTRRTALQAMLMAGATAPYLSAALGGPMASLKEAYKKHFRVGAAINAAQIREQDPRGNAIIEAQFSSISPEDCLKWENVHPEPERYDFSLTDQYVAYGEKNAMFVVGHVLVWHVQTPDWVFKDAKGNVLGREALLKRMADHIHTVVDRYKGRIHCWDVVNEPVANDGGLRRSRWYEIIGEDYIEKAFHYAREADPKAQLVYNDYDVEGGARRQGADVLIAKLKAAGAPVTAVGLQGHYRLDTPKLNELDGTIAAFGKMGFHVPMTELDVTVLPPAARVADADASKQLAANPALNPYASGLPESVAQALAHHYADLFAVFRKHAGVVDRVSFWGVSDGDNWKNDWPIKGRTDYPLLFDRAGRGKAAFDAVIAGA